MIAYVLKELGILNKTKNKKKTGQSFPRSVSIRETVVHKKNILIIKKKLSLR